MRKHAGTTLRLAAGFVFLILGVVGALLPVLQGWIFFLLAALMFFPNHPRAEKGLRRLERRMPRLVRWLRRLGFGTIEGEIINLDIGELVHHHHDHPHEESERERQAGPGAEDDEHSGGRERNVV
ncbi:MAG TPA: DUF454 family protein [Thermoanaerobaculia bacterium]|nr:DUF454 family protein [Thermoanaerobaculia bacterium]